MRSAPVVACLVLASYLLTIAPTEGAAAPAAALTAAQVRVAYGEARLFAEGFRGQGTTVVIPAAYDGSHGQAAVASDFAEFSALNHLRSGGLSFRYVGFGGVDVNGSSLNAGWGEETALDTQAVHAVAPRANVLVVYALGNTASLMRATALALNGSWGEDYSLSFEDPDGSANALVDYTILNASLKAAAERGASVFAASGDCGAYANSSSPTTVFPASSPWVVSVGATVLSAGPLGAWNSEVGWSGTGGVACANQGGSGGGFGPLGNEVPIVAAIGGTDLEISYAGFIRGIGGTSLAAPLWAGFYAVLQSALHRPIGWLIPIVRAIGTDPWAYARGFHDITQGFNGYACSIGPDPVTGYGSPKVGGLAWLLNHPSAWGGA